MSIAGVSSLVDDLVDVLLVRREGSEFPRTVLLVLPRRVPLVLGVAVAAGVEWIEPSLWEQDERKSAHSTRRARLKRAHPAALTLEDGRNSLKLGDQSRDVVSERSIGIPEVNEVVVEAFENLLDRRVSLVRVADRLVEVLESLDPELRRRSETKKDQLE